MAGKTYLVYLSSTSTITTSLLIFPDKELFSIKVVSIPRFKLDPELLWQTV